MAGAGAVTAGGGARRRRRVLHPARLDSPACSFTGARNCGGGRIRRPRAFASGGADLAASGGGLDPVVLFLHRPLPLPAGDTARGVEDVSADSKAHKVVVKGKKAAADPMKVVERVQKKTGRKVELLSPMPPPKEEKKEEEKKEEPEPPKPEEKKEEPTVLSVVLKVHMHCEACSQVIKKRILKMKGVQSVEADLKASQVTVKGVFEEAKLADYVHRRTGKHAAIVKSEPVAAESAGEAKDDKKAAEGGEEKKDDGKEEKKDGGDAGGDGKESDKQKDDGNAGDGEEKDKDSATMANLYMHYPRFNHPSGYSYAYQYPPQLFSDENPNACSVM